jgi:hypothetical protein
MWSETLRNLVQEARNRITSGAIDSEGYPALREAADELRFIIERACAEQAKREDILNVSSDVLFDLSPIPLSSLAKKGLTRLEGWLAGTKLLGRVARPLTPLTTFASLVQHELKGTSSGGNSEK